MIRALIALAVLATPALASAQDLTASQVRQQRADREYCEAQAQRVTDYANDMGWRIRRNSAEFSETGTITPYMANLTRQQLQDLMTEMKEPWRKMMYQPNRTTCVAFLNGYSRRIHSLASPVLNAND